jgi:hypothetical protein
MKKCALFLLTVVVVLTLSSCLGVQADISIRSDGSGRITLEYRVSQMLEAMGRLDGNERWPAVPVGRADFERSVARIPGLRLLSFSSHNVRRTSDTPGSGGSASTGSHDLVTRAELEFADIDALLAFLDSTGKRGSYVRGNQQDAANVLRLVLLEPSTSLVNADLLSLLKEISASYEIGISLSAPKNASLSVIPSSATTARLVPTGKKVSFAIGLGDLLYLDELALEIAW